MNTKYMIAIFAAFAVLFAGVMAADSADADTLAPPSEETGPAIVEDDGPSEVAPTVNYSVVYNVNGMLYTVDNGTSNVVTLSAPDALGAVAPAGMTFKNWTTAGANYAAGSTYLIPVPRDAETASVEFTAAFDYTVYTATFKAFDGSVLGAPITGTTQNPVNLATVAADLNVVREGYIFAGWMAEGVTEAVATADLPALTANVVYTAAYTVDYKIVFIDGKTVFDTVGGAPMSVSNVVVPNLGTRDGFNFLGWFVDSEQVADPAAYVLTVSEDTTFTAKWEPINVYVTFKAGDAVSEPVPVLYGKTVIVPALPEGYSAWDFDFDTPITEDVTIVAIPAAPAEPSGLDDPVNMTMAIILVILLGAIVCGVGVLKKKGKIVIGRGPNAKSNENKEGEIKP